MAQGVSSGSGRTSFAQAETGRAPVNPSFNAVNGIYDGLIMPDVSAVQRQQLTDMLTAVDAFDPGMIRAMREGGTRMQATDGGSALARYNQASNVISVDPDFLNQVQSYGLTSGMGADNAALVFFYPVLANEAFHAGNRGPYTATLNAALNDGPYGNLNAFVQAHLEEEYSSNVAMFEAMQRVDRDIIPDTNIGLYPITQRLQPDLTRLDIGYRRLAQGWSVPELAQSEIEGQRAGYAQSAQQVFTESRQAAGAPLDPALNGGSVTAAAIP